MDESTLTLRVYLAALHTVVIAIMILLLVIA